jgi:hypothetical protein
VCKALAGEQFTETIGDFNRRLWWRRISIRHPVELKNVAGFA